MNLVVLVSFTFTLAAADFDQAELIVLVDHLYQLGEREGLLVLLLMLNN